MIDEFSMYSFGVNEKEILKTNKKVMSMNKKNNDFVLIENDETKDSSIIIHNIANSIKIGTVVAIGDGYYYKYNNKKVPLTVKVNQKVQYPINLGVELQIQSKNYILLKEKELYAIIN